MTEHGDVFPEFLNMAVHPSLCSLVDAALASICILDFMCVHLRDAALIHS